MTNQLTNLGRITYWGAAITAFVVTASVFPIYQIFGAVIGFYLGWMDIRNILKTFNCSLGEYVVITSGGNLDDLEAIISIKKYCKILTVLGMALYVFQSSIGWFGRATVDILDAIFPTWFKFEASKINLEDFEKLKKNFDRYLSIVRIKVLAFAREAVRKSRCRASVTRKKRKSQLAEIEENQFML